MNLFDWSERNSRQKIPDKNQLEPDPYVKKSILKNYGISKI